MSRQRHTRNCRLKAVRLVQKGLTVTAAACISGTSRSSVYRWLKLQQQANIRDGLAQRASTLQRKISHLQAELAWTQAKMTAWE